MSVSHLAPTAQFTKNNGVAQLPRMSRLVMGFVVVVAFTAFIKLVGVYLEANQETICEQAWLTENRVMG